MIFLDLYSYVNSDSVVSLQVQTRFLSEAQLTNYGLKCKDTAKGGIISGYNGVWYAA